ncbi:MAG TPA: MBOAT family O-acyltransferase [Abditibacteriaceae bacterium]|jgi:D-alanyl-lipoteichoic acid acyltransferase DltB (MBOAT superfamily)
MTFTTPTFLIFLAITFLSYWSLPRRAQNWLILAASLLFYGWWDWRFLFLLFFNAGIDYYAALKIAETEDARKRKTWLLVSLVSNLGVLGFFKYFNFFADSFARAGATIGLNSDPIVLRVILPVGISFFTFQALSYTIDVYRKQMHPVRDMVAYFGFICFFPHMVAGPIQRATHLLVQFEHKREWNAELAADGVRQMLWGVFKKMVIADNLAKIVNEAYGNIGSASGWQLLIATYAFAFQIYCDFSGYTDIAIGCARLFGFDMTRNFAYPYFSRSIPEFWRRWHISLSTWFREYLYIPLGGNRVPTWRKHFNVLVVFLASGLWHGANWTFIVWGLIHGLLFLLPIWGRDDKTDAPPGGERRFPTLRDGLAMLATFHLVCFAWIFFRAASVGEAFQIIQRIGLDLFSGQWSKPPGTGALVLIAVLLTIEWVQRAKRHPLEIQTWPRPARWALYYAVVLLVLVRAELGYTPFIYFQF